MGDIHRGLLWSPIRHNRQGAIRYDDYIAPSWQALIFAESLGDNDEGYLYLDQIRWTIDPLAEILDVSVRNANGNPFGQVKSGSLTIHGECYNICSCSVLLAFFEYFDERNYVKDEDDPAFFNSICNRGLAFLSGFDIQGMAHPNGSFYSSFDWKSDPT